MLDLSLNAINASNKNIYIDNDLEAALQELDILFNTENTELLGDTDFGINIEQYLWTLTPMTESLKEYLNSKLLNLYYLKKFNYNLNVSFYSGDYRSIYYISIDIYLDNKQKIKKEYTFK